MKFHKIELIVVDFEGFGADELIESINGNYIVKVVDVESIDVEWSDDNPLNSIFCSNQEAIDEFNRLKNESLVN